jgi:hypothetical protein
MPESILHRHEDLFKEMKSGFVQFYTLPRLDSEHGPMDSTFDEAISPFPILRRNDRYELLGYHE